jgi:hypothetical protein
MEKEKAISFAKRFIENETVALKLENLHKMAENLGIKVLVP